MSLRDASRFAIVVLMAAVLTLLVRQDLLTNRPLPLMLQVVAALLMIWARVTFGLRSFHGAATPTAGGIVTTGPYAYIRHPIYAAILLFVWAGVSAHLSLTSAGLGALASVAIAARIVAEERLVARRYPEYDAYKARTRRIIPFVF